jgi:2-polyprenyl-3-methyl-5-hydroxy-6-metoxy-1,4-benzoquinol methylase
MKSYFYKVVFRLAKAIKTKYGFVFQKSSLSGSRASKSPIAKPYHWGNLDWVVLEPCGLLRVEGWAKDDIPNFNMLSVYVDGRKIPIASCFRTHRPDVVASRGSNNAFCGFIFEYIILPEDATNETNITNISGYFNGDKIFEFRNNFRIQVPHYFNLFFESNILHREDIYGSGPPAMHVIPEILSLANTLPGPILDFGCGRGALVKQLRDHGVEAFGIELKRREIIDSLYDEVRPYVTLYDGCLPTPFKDNSFESVICIEVLEHIPNYQDAITDIARIVRSRVIVTVPDISVIPVCHRYNIVPWHLLEETHVNFFTQRSLLALLEKYFSNVKFARICLTDVNGTLFFSNLVALCHK